MLESLGWRNQAIFRFQIFELVFYYKYKQTKEFSLNLTV